jgi:uncharacterized glyoxalase superfamily protein PhnB
MSSATRVQPYLFFEGRCEEALEFYRRAGMVADRFGVSWMIYVAP